LNQHPVSGDAAGATKARRKVANLTIELEAAQKAADASRAKAEADAAAAIDSDMHQIVTAAIADVNAILAQHGVSGGLAQDDRRFMSYVRQIAAANQEKTADRATTPGDPHRLRSFPRRSDRTRYGAGAAPDTALEQHPT